MTRREAQCNGILSTSLLDAIVPSKPNRDLPWQIAKTVQAVKSNGKLRAWVWFDTV